MPPDDSVTLEMGESSTPPLSEDFEEINYPHARPHEPPTYQTEELPLYHINEDKARRRVVRGHGTGDQTAEPLLRGGPYAPDDKSDVYAKLRQQRPRHSTGWSRLTPPPASIVRV